MSGQIVADHPFFQRAGVFKMAHRGGAGLWPPNTMYAYERAVEMGMDALEMDVHRTADGVLVVRHDPTVDATTNGSGKIKKMPLSILQALDAGYTWGKEQGYPYRGQGIRIPTLEEVLQAFPDVRLNIDLKMEEPQAVDQFVDLLRKYDRVMKVNVGSFHDSQLYRYRKLAPAASTAAGDRETRLFFALQKARLSRFYKLKANVFQLPEYHNGTHVVTPHFIQAAHAQQVEVHVWTVNDKSQMHRLIHWGVDGIITDYPDRLLEVLEERADRA